MTDPRLTRRGQCSVIHISNSPLDTSALTVHVLSAASRSRLLLHRHPWGVVPAFPGPALLANLHALAPGVADLFAPKTPDLPDLVFRLVNEGEGCRSKGAGAKERAEEDEEDAYVAMSYCWRKRNREVVREKSRPGALPFGWVKTVEKFPIPTSMEMFAAVLRERRGGGDRDRDGDGKGDGEGRRVREGVWFDQVGTVVFVQKEMGLRKRIAVTFDHGPCSRDTSVECDIGLRG
jgi:hypothetical protein